MNEYTWRQSGLDARSHAFPSQGGFIRSSQYQHPTLDEPVEHYAAACGLVLPLAFAMSQSGGDRCDTCTRVSEAPHWGPRLVVDRVAELVG